MSDAPGIAPRRRFVALDIFRGITIFLMIVVNTAGAGAKPFTQLVHTPWFGFTLADAIFPSFLFAMGNAMSFASRAQLSNRTYVGRLARRAAIIFLLGFLMSWFPFVTHTSAGWEPIPFSVTRIPGVLQRLALCYFAAGLMVRWLNPRQIVLAGIALLLGYWAILLTLSAPGMAYDKFGNIGTHLDLWLLGPDHLYKKDHGFDPEGLLGTLPAIVNVLGGYIVGLVVQKRASLQKAVREIMVVGIALVIAGLAWSPWFPIAKKLWTSSYVLLTIGIDCIALGCVIILFELAGIRKGVRFFTILGRNPLAIYLFSELFVVALNQFVIVSGEGVYDWVGIAVFQRIVPGAIGSLLCAVTYTMLCWAVGWWMDRKRLILKA